MKFYLRENRRTAAGYILFLLIFGIVYALYGLPPGPFAYAALLTAAAFVAAFAAGCNKYRDRLCELSEAVLMAEEDFFSLPAADTRAEELYQEALTAVDKRRKEEQSRTHDELLKAQQYYALWSHQIKTPLAALRLLFEEETVDRRAAGQELLKAEQYVEMALQYQRLGGGTGDLMLKEYHLENLVKQAVKKTAQLFIYKNLAVQLSPLAQRTVTDEKWLVFVLEQLLTNAVKYTRKGGIRIYETDRELVIEDTGIGILPEDLPRVFEWGYTGFNGRVDKHSTGIGLSLCRQMLDRLGHEIRLESVPGKGTKVFLKLERERFEIE